MQTVKVEYYDTVRRVQLDLSQGYSNLKIQVSNLLNVPVSDFVIKYLDEDKELITIGSSDLEFKEFLTASEKKGSVRLIVVKKENLPSSTVTTESLPNDKNFSSSFTSSIETKKQEQPDDDNELNDMYDDDNAQQFPNNHTTEQQQNPKVSPTIKIAQLLSNDKIVQDIQEAISSQVVTDAIVHLAESYLDESDPFALPKTIFSELPLLQGVLSELLTKNPELAETSKEISGNLFQQFIESHLFGKRGCCEGRQSFNSFPCFSNKFACNSAQRDYNTSGAVKTIHSNIYCDGCSNHHDLFVTALREGSVSRSGQIFGARYKSVTVEDFDLCESCEATGYFQNSHGPFLKITNPAQAPAQIICVLRPDHTDGTANGCTRRFRCGTRKNNGCQSRCHPSSSSCSRNQNEQKKAEAEASEIGESFQKD